MRRRYYRRKKGIAKKEAPFFKETKPMVQSKEEKQPFFQTKGEEGLTTGQPGDKYEVEADAMADAVVNNSKAPTRIQAKEISSIQRVEEEEALQTRIQRQTKEEEPALQTQSKEEEIQAKSQEEEVQMQAEEEELQAKSEEEEVQMQGEEELQAKSEEEEVQMQAGEEELQAKSEEEEVQMQSQEEEIQSKEEEEPAVQTKTNGKPKANTKLSNQIKQSSGSGKALNPKTKRQMEGAFGVDFSKVSIHTNSKAVQMNKELHAHAFTHGNDIYFNNGKYQPETTAGKHLLAHELTHVVQQSNDIHRKEKVNNSVAVPLNPIVGLKKGDGLVFGTWHLRPRVNLLQKKLNEKIASSLNPDGMFGTKTMAALNAFKITMSSENTENTLISLKAEEETSSIGTDFEPASGASEVVDQPTADALMGIAKQKEIPLIDSDVMYVLTPPPPICQGDSFVCWAAAAASWLNATGVLPGVTKEDLIIRFGGCICDDGSMPEKFVPDVYEELGIHLSHVRFFHYHYLKEKLKDHGHVILIVDTGSVEHAVVAYAVGVSDTGKPDNDFYSVFDPIDCKYHNLRFGSQTILSIGIGGALGPKASCPNVDSLC